MEYKTNPSGKARDLKKFDSAILQMKLYIYAFQRVFGRRALDAQIQLVETGVSLHVPTDREDLYNEAHQTILEAVTNIRAKRFDPNPSFVNCTFCPHSASRCVHRSSSVMKP